MYYGVPRKSVAVVWQKDLFRFLPKGQGDIKCQLVQSVYSFLLLECLFFAPFVSFAV